MSDNTRIEWSDATWNPVTGCTKVSPGCDRCYAETFAERWRGTSGHYFEQGFDLTLRPERLDQPLGWKRPRRIFVNSMSDLFHDDVPTAFIAEVFAVMTLSPQHTFQVLTKRHGRMRALMGSDDFRSAVARYAVERAEAAPGPPYLPEEYVVTYGRPWWPLRNVWLGVSVEDQKRADLRIPALLDTPAVVRWLSCEPLLGPVDLRSALGGRQWGHAGQHHGTGEPGCPRNLHHHHDKRCKFPIDWVVCGGESGPGARPMHPVWAESLRDQCVRARVPFLFKQWGEWSPLAPIDCQGRFDFRRAHSLADDGTLYEPGALAYPDGPRYGEAVRAGHDRANLTAMYRVGKKAAGRELDGRPWDEYPAGAR